MHARAKAIARVDTRPRTALALTLTAATVLALWGTAARSDDHIITSHGISIFGELKYGPDFPHFDYVNPDAPKGGTMRFVGTGASTTFDSLNPFILKGTAAQGLGLMHDTLLTGSADEADASYGYIAETLEYPQDRSWVIFNMRPEATFSDGHPIEASDVVFSYNILLEKGRPVYKIIYQDIASVEALDTHRVKFTFQEEAPKREVIQLAGGISILPEHYWADRDFAESSLEPPVSSGGYLVADVEPSRSIRYCRNPDYWGWDHPANVGANNFDCYLYEFFADRDVAFEAFKSGGYYLHESFSSIEWATRYDFPALTEHGLDMTAGHEGDDPPGYPERDLDRWMVKTQIADNRPAGTQGFWINTRKPHLQDERVREALGLMFNFEWSNETLFYGIYDRTDSFWENTSTMQAAGLPEGEELAVLEPFRDQLPEEIFTEEVFTPIVNNPQRISRAILRRANALLDEAGWVLEEGIRKKDGQTLVIEMVDDSPAFERIINPYVENLKRLGIDARYALIDGPQMEQRQKDYDFDLIPGRLVMSLTPGLELRQIFGSAAAAAPDTVNYAGVADPVVDALIEKVIEAPDRTTMEARVRALDRVLRDKHIWVPNWYKGSHNIAYWDIFGRPDGKPFYSRGDAYWWLDQEKYDALKAAGAPLQ